VYVVAASVSDDDSMDIDSSHTAANMACVLDFVKKMLAIVSLCFVRFVLFTTANAFHSVLHRKGIQPVKNGLLWRDPAWCGRTPENPAS